MSRCRFRLFDFFVRMCRACECPRLIFPVAVSRTRLAVPLCVLSFGIITPEYSQNLVSKRHLNADVGDPIGNRRWQSITSYSEPLDGSGGVSALGAAGSALTAAVAALGAA